MRSSYNDFDDYKDDAMKLLNEGRAKTFEDAYLLAKATRNTNQPTQRHVETERPSGTPVTRRTGRPLSSSEEKRPERVVSLNRSFRDSLNNALTERFGADGVR